MNIRHHLITGMVSFLLASIACAEVAVTTGRNPDGDGFRFQSVPSPSQNDAAAKAVFTLVDGVRDPNGAGLTALQDGRVPSEEDQPGGNFFFRAGTPGGRIQVDLGSVIEVKQVCSYSWHAGSRGPQVYQLFAADGAGAGFVAAPKQGTNPASCGWTLVASVDTRPKDSDERGQYGAAVSDSAQGILGRYRYLLFVISPTETRDAFGHTFFSEIDVVDAQGPALIAAASGAAEQVFRKFETQDGKYQFSVNVTAAPDLANWVDSDLKPIIQEWYPKLVGMLPGDGFTASSNVGFRFRDDMGGVPASASGNQINLNIDWFRREPKEAVGAVVHEMVHVVQDYWRANRVNAAATRTPGWIIEGIPDYIRWFLYEPQSRGAEITERNLAQARYDASYRVSGNFLNWVTLKYDKDIVLKLNAAAREGRYSEQIWKDSTGKTISELGDEWKQSHEERIRAARAGNPPKA